MQDERLRDFRNFVFLVHRFINLPNPTELQDKVSKDIVDAPDRSCFEAFRGMGKSHLSSIYAIHTLYWNPEAKILVISATSGKAREFVKFCKDVVFKCPHLAHMRPSGEGRNLSHSFDIGNINPSQTPSLDAKGLTAQITGSRATHIIADDIEISTNARTIENREKIFYLSAEFESIILPGGRIIWLGTPHSASSVYNTLEAKGYRIYKYPIFDNNGDITEPSRFTMKDLEARRRVIGESVFRLQFMLDTSLADSDKYPLHLSDLVVSEEFGGSQCRERYTITTEPIQINIKESKGSDRPYASKAIGYKVDYLKKILAIDPSGRGKDEFAWCVLGTRNGYIFNIDNGAWDRYTSQTPLDIKQICDKYSINEIVIETNFGDVLLENLIQPHVKVAITSVRATTQKELRIISTIEPILNSHQLVVNRKFLEDEKLIGQLCNITADKRSIQSDDRIDALALGCKHLTDFVRVSLNESIEKEHIDRIEDEMLSEIGGKKNTSWF